MKRLIMLAVLCSFVLSAAAASAADIKASGSWAVEAVWHANWDFADKVKTARGANSSFQVYQRATTTFEFIANENLKGVMQLRYGTERWGRNSFGLGNGDSGSTAQTLTTVGAGDSTTSGYNRITVRQAYVDFNWPDTSVHVRAGYQGISLPAAFGGGSMILDDEIGAAVVSGPITDNVSYLVGYARAVSLSGATTVSGATASTNNRYLDAYVAALPLSFEGFSIAPFGMYAPISNGFAVGDATGNMVGLAAMNATNNARGANFDNAYWLGAAFTMDLFDPFVLKADLNYGKVQSKLAQNRKSGWLFDMALEYKGWDFMTPEVFFAYSTGEDGNSSKGSGKSERMPILAAQNWAVGSFFFGGDRLLAGSIPTTANRAAQAGYWVLGLSLKDIQSFAEGLTHDAHILFAKGTNDKDTRKNTGSVSNYNNAYGLTLTEKDSIFEIDFNTGYKLYDELTLSLDLGYVNYNTKESRQNLGAANTGLKGGDAWKVSTGVLYQF